MKLLLDANLSWRLTTVLSEHFSECVHVNKTELPKPAKDTEIWNYAAANGYTIEKILLLAKSSIIELENSDYGLLEIAGIAYQNLINLYLSDCAVYSRKINIVWK